MLTLTYTGSFNTTSAGTSGKYTMLTAPGTLPPGALVLGMTYALNVTGGSYSASANWRMHWLAIGSETGSPYARKKVTNNNYETHSKMVSDDWDTLTGEMFYTDDDVTMLENNSSIMLYTKISNSLGSASYLGDVSVTISYVCPTLSKPTDVLVNGKLADYGESAIVTWRVPQFTDIYEPITYYVVVENTMFAECEVSSDAVPGTKLSLTIPSDVLEYFGRGKSLEIHVEACHDVITSGASDPVRFMWITDHTMAYHDGEKWVECIVYYHDGTQWTQCDAYYHDGEKWNDCSIS